MNNFSASDAKVPQVRRKVVKSSQVTKKESTKGHEETRRIIYFLCATTWYKLCHCVNLTTRECWRQMNGGNTELHGETQNDTEGRQIKPLWSLWFSAPLCVPSFGCGSAALCRFVALCGKIRPVQVSCYTGLSSRHRSSTAIWRRTLSGVTASGAPLRIDAKTSS